MSFWLLHLTQQPYKQSSQLAVDGDVYSPSLSQRQPQPHHSALLSLVRSSTGAQTLSSQTTFERCYVLFLTEQDHPSLPYPRFPENAKYHNKGLLAISHVS